MSYTYWELLFFFLCYSFLGWCAEVVVAAVRTHRFCNRGVLSLPFCPAYGLGMDIMIVSVPTLRGALVLQAVLCLLVCSACEQLSSGVSRWLTKTSLREGRERSLFSGRKQGIWYALLLTACALVTLALLHPMLYFLYQFIPKTLLKVSCGVLGGLMLLDCLEIFLVAHRRPDARLKRLTEEMGERKTALSFRLQQQLWKRLNKAYPEMEEQATLWETGEKSCVFAKGLCLHKLIWVFLICALGGDIIETFYVHAVSGIWMSRSSVIYGPFSVVWGLGAAILTALLFRLAHLEDRYIFLSGFFLGGAYEYLCSVFSEVVLGTTFWDYSDMPFNIGGRTNLLFCLFWGILALVWVKLVYPRLSKLIERIPPLAGVIITWVLVALMACDLALSGLAVLRYVARQSGMPPVGAVEEFVDLHYPDETVETVWPNMRMDGVLVNDLSAAEALDQEPAEAASAPAEQSD